jgi:hypothetical protein
MVYISRSHSISPKVSPKATYWTAWGSVLKIASSIRCSGPVSSGRLFGFLSEKIIQFVVVEAVEM